MSKGKMIRNVFTGTAVLLLAGFIYAWSVLSYPIAQTYPQWAGGALGLAFTLCMAFFCLGGLLGGLTGNRISLGLRLLCSGVFLAAGFFLSAAARQPWMLVAGYGILCGTGSGLAYNGVISFGNRCFPEKSRGLLLGILLMGFGAGGFLFGSAYTALTPAGEGWRQSLRVVGLLSFGVLGIGARLLREEKTGDEQRRAHPGGYTPGQMLKTPHFGCFFSGRCWCWPEGWA